jgi:glycosyltransferase involved in cell wall biosynthesis
MPVYNAEKHLRESLDALVSQSFIDFELIISDNASTDNTSEICLEYSKKDHRIRYIRQITNIGSWQNFKYVLEKSQSEYFMWSAHDDVKSFNFIELNYSFLTKNKDHVASTCPNRFEAKHEDISFSMNESNNFERYIKFFSHCWFSHGIFYSLIRTDILKKCELLEIDNAFFAIDWGVDVFIASRGKINLTDEGFIYFRKGGESQSTNHYRKMRTSHLEFYFEFYKLNMYVLRLCKSLSLIKKCRMIFIFLMLNAKFNVSSVKTKLKSILYL